MRTSDLEDVARGLREKRCERREGLADFTPLPIYAFPPKRRPRLRPPSQKDRRERLRDKHWTYI